MAKSVRIILNKEVFVQFTPFEGFSFVSFCAQVRVDRCYLGPDVFVPIEKIEMIIFGDFDAAPARPHTGVMN